MKNRFLRIILALFGLSIVIIIHELGHLLAAKLLAVPAPLFSIGFGPVLFAVTIGSTIYQIGMLPLGGYVLIPQEAMQAISYPKQLLILCAGVVANIIFAYAILLFFRLRSINVGAMIHEATQNYQRGMMGPIGIISMISSSAALGIGYFFLVLGALSMSIGIFNLFPIPFLDGGQIVWYTLQAIMGPLPDSLYSSASNIFLAIFFLFLLYISMKDMRLLGK